MLARVLTAMFALPLLVAPALAQDAAPAADGPGAGGKVKLSATLSGAGGVDAEGNANQGDPDGTGSFSATLDAKANKLCYTLSWSGIDDPTMAHIHAGAAGRNGPVVIGLANIDPGERCQDVDQQRADQILAKPADFYVNVHNGDFPGGAIRGQLAKQ